VCWAEVISGGLNVDVLCWAEVISGGLNVDVLCRAEVISGGLNVGLYKWASSKYGMGCDSGSNIVANPVTLLFLVAQYLDLGVHPIGYPTVV